MLKYFLICQTIFLIYKIHFLILEDQFLILENEFLILELKIFSNIRNFFLIFEIHFLLWEDRFLILENDFFPQWLAILFVSFRFDLFRFVSFRFYLFRFVSVSFRTLQGPVKLKYVHAFLAQDAKEFTHLISWKVWLGLRISFKHRIHERLHLHLSFKKRQHIIPSGPRVTVTKTVTKTWRQRRRRRKTMGK